MTETPSSVTLPVDSAEIERLLPHRYPFLLVDRVVEFEPGKRILAWKNVTGMEMSTVMSDPRLYRLYRCAGTGDRAA